MRGQKISSPLALINEQKSLGHWHHRLGHLHFSMVNKVVHENSLPCSSFSSSFCFSCLFGKSKGLSLKSIGSISSAPLKLVFSGVWRPFPKSLVDGHRYFVLFQVDYSKFTWIYPIARKSNVVSIFFQYQIMVENLFDHKIKYFQLDWDGEFRPLQSHFLCCGIVHRVACPYTR